MAQGMERKESILDRPLLLGLAWDWETVAWLFILIFTVLTRFWDLGSRAQHHDESMHAFFSWELYQGRGYIHNPLLHGPFLFEITALVYFFLGASDYAARVAPALFGVTLVILPYFLRRWLGRKGALAIAAMLAISPAFLYFTRFIRHDVFAVTFEFMLFVTLFKYLEEKKDLFLYVAVAILAFLFSTMEIAFITTFVFSLFSWLVLQFLYWQRVHGSEQGLNYFLVSTAITALLAGVGIWALGGELSSWARWIVLLIVGVGALGLQLPAILDFLSRALRGWRFPPLQEALQDLVLVLGTLTLILSSALPMRILGVDPMAFVGRLQSNPLGAQNLFSDSAIWKAGLIFLLVLAVAVGIGLLWDRRRWIVCAGIFLGIYLLLHTTFLTNMLGLATGTVGSLGYWLVQHEVRRGGQPWYYYGILLPLYEFLPLALATVGGLRLFGRLIENLAIARSSSQIPRPLTKGANPLSPSEPNPGQESLGPRQLVAPFFLFWVILALVIYSWAGEKMPWLSLHLALPAILLAGYAFNSWTESAEWEVWRRPEGWGLLGLLFMGTLVVLASFSTFPDLSDFPTLGTTLEELNRTMRFLGYLSVLLGTGFLVYLLVRRLGSRAWWTVITSAFLLILVLLTVRFAFLAAYQHGDIAKDMLIYTQTTPDVTMVVGEIEDLSERLVGGKNMVVAFDDFTSWPMWWYLRAFPNKVYFGKEPSGPLDAPVALVGLENEPQVRPYLVDYIRQQYRLRWWFPEEYRDLSPDRIRTALLDPVARENLLRFLLYREIDEPLGSSDFAFYIRRDIAARLWRSGAIPLSPEIALGEAYAQKRIEHISVAIFGSPGSGLGQFNFPKEMDVDSRGQIYVADSANHRIQVLAPDGNALTSWGDFGTEPGQFNEPWGLAVDEERGFVYVADTWNHRIQKFDLEGNYLTEWGTFADSGGQASGFESFFFGPRDIVIDEEGNLYVADTGNERIQKFSPDGVFLGQWGGEGTGPGQFREPVGIVIGPQGKIYVADTWNQRIQVFDRDFNFLAEWPLQAWESTSVVNKPYLAVDSQGRVWVSDPEGYRILVFDEEGGILATFGRYGSEASNFNLPTGVALDTEGYLYVADSANHRIMKFPPLP